MAPAIEHSSGRLRQSIIGLSLAAAVVGAWVGLHLFAMFAFDLTWSSLPVAIAMAAITACARI